MNTQLLLAAMAALPLGDDTPIGLYVGIGIIALLLIAAVIVMNIIAKKKK